RMSPFLAIDTSVGTSVALVAGGSVLAEVNIDDRMGHAENIGLALAEVIKRADVAPSRISAVIAGRGPAPFTGLRVGIAAAIAFAEGVARPIFGVVSHDAIALAELTELAEAGPQTGTQTGSPLLVTTDARRSEVYWSLYSGLDHHGCPVRIDGPHVNKPDELESILDARGLSPITAKASVSAAALARVAERQMLAGGASQDVTALYLRAPDAVAPKDVSRTSKAVS
ncbi:MAG: tRNA (adenosine(37)-N6)-threonylcarbamoyltransferase complex dimerization subunit type 1 TsaB, partial [Actinomycetales bacterium]|nr:tRNA (adenosine(37)-N6)-threonylcarbamoyltransferase complex dimerization subunit type 1 TsaB [Actinomycetales bacterium]